MHAYHLRMAGCVLLATSALGQTSSRVTRTSAAVAPTRITQGIESARIERIAPDRARLTVATKVSPGAAMRLLDATGKEVAATRAVDGTIKAEVDPKLGYILTPAAPESRAMPKEGLHFPARYVTFTPAPERRSPPKGGMHFPTRNVTVSTKEDANLGGLFIRPAVVPLTWNEEVRAYATELFVGYEFEDGREINLPAPKTVTFFAEGANARIEADRVTVRKSGGSGYQRVVLSTGEVQGETHFTARVSAADELKASVTVLREPGALKLSLPSTKLPAFGVGSAVLTVSLLARDGSPFATRVPLKVSLTSRGLRQPALLVLEPGKSFATVDVRTTGYGRGEVVAQSGGFQAALPVMLVFPTAALVAAVVGGGIGGAARFLRNRRRKGGALLSRRIIEGMVVGLILVGAAWAGMVAIDLSTGVLGTPFGAFVLGALSGYLGCVVLDGVAKHTFRGVKAGA